MRTILAAAAAGALIMGSAAGATAASGAKGPKAKVELSSVSIHGHSPINFWDITATPTNSVRTLKLRATVKDTKDVLVSPQDVLANGSKVATTVLVDAAQYAKKVGGLPVTPSVVTLDDVQLPMVKEKKHSKNYAAEYTFTPVQQAAVKAYLTTKAAAAVTAGVKLQKTYLCIADADLSPEVGTMTTSKQTKKRLGQSGKAVRDCVQLVNVDPATTDTHTDDPV